MRIDLRVGDPCSECGAELEESRGPGRYRNYRGGRDYEIPHDLVFARCPKCGAEWMTGDQINQLSDAFEAERARREAANGRVRTVARLEKYETRPGQYRGRVWVDVYLDASPAMGTLFFSGPWRTARALYEGSLMFKGSELVEPEALMVDPYHPELGFKEPQPTNVKVKCDQCGAEWTTSPGSTFVCMRCGRECSVRLAAVPERKEGA